MPDSCAKAASRCGRRSGSAMMAMRLVMAVTIARTAPHQQNLSDRPENSPNASLKPAALPVADKASSSAGPTPVGGVKLASSPRYLMRSLVRNRSGRLGPADLEGCPILTQVTWLDARAENHTPPRQVGREWADP